MPGMLLPLPIGAGARKNGAAKLFSHAYIFAFGPDPL
jgi:hypothetical protein